MRQNQQNRRMRGRGNNGGGGNNNNNNNNRRGPNPLTRSYESNGPDVKIRGTAQHIAEKYMSLARDSHSSGDRVMAENYLQHAEHYNRLIAAALAQQQAIREQREVEEEDLGEDAGDNRFASNPLPGSREQSDSEAVFDGDQPQPVVDVPVSVVAVAAETDDQPREVRPERALREAADGPRDNGLRNRRRERVPRPPREPKAEAAGETVVDAPEEGGLLATLSRGADKPIVVTVEE